MARWVTGIVALCIVAGVAVSGKASEDEGTIRGERFLRQCSQAVEALDKNGDASAEKNLWLTWCEGYVQGFNEGMMALAGNESKSASDIPNSMRTLIPVCWPEHVSYNQILRVAVKYLQQHPELLNAPAAMLVMDSEMEAWPCRSPSR